MTIIGVGVVWTTGAGVGVCTTGAGVWWTTGLGLGFGLTGAGSGEGPVGTGSGEGESANAGAAAQAKIAAVQSSAIRALRRAADERILAAADPSGGDGRAVIGQSSLITPFGAL